MWNILFSCTACGLNTDSYDEAVAHSQNHLNGSPVISEQAHCRVCDLRFHIKCYRKHIHLHKQLPVNKKDFLILPYRYRALFKNQWFNLFGKLAPRKVQQIIMQSIYRHTRRADLRVVKNGRLEYTLFVCKLCNVCVKGQCINKHIRSSCSRIDENLHCSYCDIYFDTADIYKRHETIHKKIDFDFRVVQFGAMASSVRTPVSRTSNSLTANEKCFLFYKCAYCKLSVLCKGEQVKNHVCYYGVQNTCHLCGLGYRVRFKMNHMRLHKKYPMLSRKTVKCQMFRPKHVKPVPGSTSESGQSVPPSKERNTYAKPHNKDMERTENDENQKMLTSKLYLVNCKTCKSFFKRRRELVAHYPECSGRVSEAAERVDRPPDESELTLYKCIKCLCHFLHWKSLKMHGLTCQSVQRELRTCGTCGLNFTQISLKKHMSRHHMEKKYSFKVLEPITGETQVYSV